LFFELYSHLQSHRVNGGPRILGTLGLFELRPPEIHLLLLLIDQPLSFLLLLSQLLAEPLVLFLETLVRRDKVLMNLPQ